MLLSRPSSIFFRRITSPRCLAIHDLFSRDFSTTPSSETTKPSVLLLLPGVALSAATSAAGFQVASVLSSALAIPISGIPVSILLGMAMKNTVLGSQRIHLDTQPGIAFSTKAILQGGIVAVAAKLSFFELLSTGTHGIPVVVSSVGAGLFVIPMAGRFAGLPGQMSLLLTAGTSICGVTAITALAPAIHASNRDTAVAVANTVAFGTLGMLVYPYLFHELCTSSEQVGMCLGVAIHDTSQVLGSAMSYRDTFDDDVALRVAAVTKLTRNLGLAFAIPALVFVHQKAATPSVSDGSVGNTSETVSGLVTFQRYVPPFLVAFIAMSTFRSCGDFYFGEDAPGLYHEAVSFIGNDVSKYALGTAMAGVGLSTSASSLKGVGWRPFAVGGAGALVVGGTGFTVASFLI